MYRKLECVKVREYSYADQRAYQRKQDRVYRLVHRQLCSSTQSEVWVCIHIGGVSGSRLAT